ncbi:MAG TPA: enoyl-CoA hydratase/isomerase family protein, partial [Mycobacterium sp.]|nr:enoyl-CoA hydratase/isomerase family protein [Mycobacterium sp.]
MTEYQTIKFEQAGAITRITLNRPDAANGMDDTMTRELADAARRCDTEATKVVVITGSGRFFCAGGDLKSFASAPSRSRYIKGIADDLHRAISTFARMDAVLITSVNGVAAGAGFSFAVTGDLVLAAESASFTMAYTRAGLSPDGSAS